ncbi:MAG TPA: valine--tRNA ligase [Actinomycetota bacterium]|nr:valine--tRNA ligase [Actinomycetota bacterium]
MSERTRDLPSRYDPTSVEPHWARAWVEDGAFHATALTDREPYCIVIPPPNVTGRLHVGHALGRTLEDALIRRARMQGKEALWVPGMDHAGIATQVVVERELRKEGIDRRELGREAFIERVWSWKEQYGGEIVDQIKRMGASLDWERERFTMDEGLSLAVRTAFVRWYEQGFIYRGERLVNWCPTDQTGLSDSEVEHEEVDGELVTFRYPLSDGSGSVEVATTRLETMLGDTGIAVHPDDERYRGLVGATVRHPFDGRDIPIVADDAVDPSFGTGAVKVTPAHDQTDFDIATRAGLSVLNIFDAEARVNANAAEEFYGLGRYDAREAVREELVKLDLLVREERPFRHAVGHCYRCHSEIEPWISGLQWFVKVEGLKEPAKQAALDGRVRFTPERWTRAYVTWLDNLRDWNISRQLWWGHRIPAWYCPDGHVTVATQAPTECSTCGSAELEQDPDVLDTWFSSQLWPFSTLGWPDDTEDLRTFYPNAVLVTGYEILYLWVARMIMSGLSLAGDVPFHDVVIHGLVRDAHGRKMSKSLGNVIDPIEMIDRYGADALRFSLARAATGGQQDIPLAEDSIEGARNFANKIWNAARLVLGAFEGDLPELPAAERRTLPERWLLSRHQACVAEVDAALDAYLFADAAQAIFRFLWSEFCDWGLEIEKGRLDAGGPERADAAALLAWVLERTLRLLHPIMPFVTEEIWQRFGQGGSIALAPWPDPHPEHGDADAERTILSLQEIVTAVRRFRARHRIAPSRRFAARIGIPADLAREVEPLAERIERLAGLDGLTFAEPSTGKLAGETTVTLKVGAVYLPPGMFDVEAERARLSKEREEMEADLARVRGKLANDGFVAKAPAEVVDGEREKALRLGQRLEDVEAQLAQLG